MEKEMNYAIMFDPKKEREAARKRQMAEILVAQGNAPVRNEQAGGMTVLRSPLENINQAAQKYMGQYDLEKADQMDEEVDRQRSALYASALGQLSSDPEAAYSLLSQDPKVRGDALKMYAEQLMKREQMESQERLWGQRLSADSTGNMPAPMKIAGKMFELERTMHDPNASQQERFLATREYNLLGQAAKTYGFDRGVGFGDMSGYSQMGSLPPVPPPAANPNIQYPSAKSTGVSVPQGAFSAALTNPQQAAANPITANSGIDWLSEVAGSAQPVNAPQQQPIQPIQPVQAQPIAGFGDAIGQVSAQKKLQEEIAKERGKRLGEASGSLNFLNANMPKIESVVAKLDNLSDKATYTTTGRGVDFARKELGMEPRDSAIARAEYIATVDNEVLPLLRDTFGAAFTQKEGETLRNTLGDPNKSPAEKKAVLSAFISQKKTQIESLQREVGAQPSPAYTAPQQSVKRAINPQTGERLINRGYGWEPAQ